MSILLLPVLYAIGMLIDVASYYVLRPLQKRRLARAKQWTEVDFPWPKRSMTIDIIIANSDLGRELLIRASRVRTARGTWLNFLIVIAK